MGRDVAPGIIWSYLASHMENGFEHGTATPTGGAGPAKGAYSELLAATAKKGVGLLVAISLPDAQRVNSVYAQVDIALGAGGSEVIKIPDLYAQWAGAAADTTKCMTVTYSIFPCCIPIGSRISCRALNSTGAATIRVDILVIESD